MSLGRQHYTLLYLLRVDLVESTVIGSSCIAVLMLFTWNKENEFIVDELRWIGEKIVEQCESRVR